MAGLIETLKTQPIPYSGKSVDDRLARQMYEAGIGPAPAPAPVNVPQADQGLLTQLMRLLGGGGEQNPNLPPQ